MAPMLRRADWRFLLPVPPGGCFRHMALLGGPPQLAGRLIDTGTATRVSTALPAAERVDALVLLADSGTSPAATAQCLAPGGVLYWEVERRGTGRLRGAGWVEHQLKRAGVQPIGWHWVIPDFAEARIYLPLDHKAAIEWFLATRFIAPTPSRVTVELLLKTARRLGDRVLGRLIPHFAVAGIRAGCSPSPAPPSDAGRELPILQCPGTRAVLLTSGQDDGSRVVLLPFAKGASEPEMVVKISRLPEFTRHTEQEQATLSHLRSAVDKELRRSLPEPLGTFERGAHRVFLETTMPGRMLAASTGRWGASTRRQISDLSVAADWLARFHLATLHRTVWDADAVDGWLERRLDGYARTFSLTRAEEDLFAFARARARSLLGQQIPIVWAHNDFGPWHLYRSGARVGVIDWEFGGQELSQRRGLPLCDLVYFVTYWIYFGRRVESGRDRQRAFRELFLGRSGSDSRCDAARHCLAEYLQRLQIHAEFLPLLVLYTWVDRAVDQASRQTSLGSRADSIRSANLFTGWVEVLAGAADRLFATGQPRPGQASAPGPP